MILEETARETLRTKSAVRKKQLLPYLRISRLSEFDEFTSSAIHARYCFSKSFISFITPLITDLVGLLLKYVILHYFLFFFSVVLFYTQSPLLMVDLTKPDPRM